MFRPVSIVNFERCYLGAFVLGLLNSALAWPQMVARASAATAQTQAGAGFASGMIVGGLVLGAIITLLLWYFVARRGSVVAKWIVVVFFVIGVVAMVRQLGSHTLPSGLPGVISIVSLVLQAVAVAMLFRPDTRAWFARSSSVDGPAIRPIDWSEPRA